MANVIQPDLQSAIICEDVRQEISGAQTLVGVINVLPAPTVPINLFKLCLWTRWCSGQGKFTQKSRIVAPDEKNCVAEAEVRFDLPQLDSHTTNVHVFGGVQFKQYGVHHVEIYLDGTLCVRFPLPVLPVKQQPSSSPF